jgi:hypothetical protein
MFLSTPDRFTKNHTPSRVPRISLLHSRVPEVPRISLLHSPEALDTHRFPLMESIDMLLLNSPVRAVEEIRWREIPAYSYPTASTTSIAT